MDNQLESQPRLSRKLVFIAFGVLALILAGWLMWPPRISRAGSCGNLCYAGGNNLSDILAACGGGGAFDCSGPCNCGLDLNGDGIPDLSCPAGQSCYYCCEGCAGGCGPTATPVPGVDNVDGSHDGFPMTGFPNPQPSNTCRATGWARDPDAVGTDIQIQIYSDASLVYSGYASSYRSDLTGVCTGGTCAFDVSLWTLVSHGVNHTISVIGLDLQTLQWVQIPNSPKTILCRKEANLSITKTDGSATEIPGTAIQYTIIIANAGPDAANGATVGDVLLAGLTGATWTCVASAGSACGAASGSGNINSTVNLANGGTATYIVNATISAGTTGSIGNTASVTAPAGVTDPATGNNSATDTDTLTPQVNLSLTKTDGSATEIPGTGIQYTLVVGNSGPSNVTGATVVDTLPVALTGVTWTCSASAGSSCGAASGSGNLNTTANVAAGGSVTYLVNATIDPAATGSLANTASVTTPAGTTETTPSNNSATDTDTLNPRANLSLTKTDGAASDIPGTAIQYTLVVGNAGPSNVTGATVVDTFPAALTGATWTCTASAGSSCGAASGSGNLNAIANIAVGGSVTYVINATISPAATGSLANTASVTAPAGTTDLFPGNNSATDTDTLDPQANLSITKADGAASAVPGTTIQYTLVVGNAGPSNVTGATVVDTLPATLTGATWTCAASAGSSCGAASGSGNLNTTANVAASGSATYLINATIVAGATGSLANTANVTAPGGTTETAPGDNTSTDTDTLNPQVNLSISKSRIGGAPIPGTVIVYQVMVANAGPSNVTGASVVDTLPAGIASATWTCSASAGSNCGAASGSGSVNTTANLAVSGSVTYVINATISSGATGSLANTASVTPPGGTTETAPGDNTSTDTVTLTPQANLSISKTSGAATAAPGAVINYTVVVANAGPSNAPGVTVIDNLPAALLSATGTCSASAGSSCGAASGSGSVNTTANLLSGGSVTYVINATIDPAATGSLSNSASVTPPGGVTDPVPGNNTTTDTITLTPQANLSISKSRIGGAPIPGTVITYQVVVANSGPSNVTGATVVDTLPVGISSATWACSASAGSSCGAASGSGSVNITANLAAGGSVTYLIRATIDPAATGSLSNSASVTPPGGVTDPTPGNNTTTDTVTLTPQADISITKTRTSPPAVAGLPISYTLVVANAGPSQATNVGVLDLVPASILNVTWICAASASSSCGVASGSGNNLNLNLSLILPSGVVTIIVTGTVDPNS